MDRRNFLVRTGLAVGATSLAFPEGSGASEAEPKANLRDWDMVRDQFELTHDWINMACLLFASNPTPVRQAIAKHRAGFDLNPADYWEHGIGEHENGALQAAADYLGAKNPRDVALTVSTTIGLGILYSGLMIRPDQEILSTTHCHYSTERSLDYKVRASGASLRRVPLYENSAKVSVQEVVSKLENEIRPNTRVVAVTFVQSSTGVKMPIGEMAKVVAKANENRADEDRAIFCVDGVHGLGIENVTMDGLGADFFVAGTHKWLFGPRGTAAIWGRTDAWQALEPNIPSFDFPSVLGWIRREDPTTTGPTLSPGGFQPYEHRWAVKEAFEFHRAMGKDRVEKRTHELNTELKNGLASMAHVTLHTPMSPELSSGIVCFDIDGMKPDEVIAALREKRVISSTTPYRTSYARLTPGLLNNEREVEATLRAVSELSA